jgi:SAM-dependent methyltransferase
VTAEALRRRFYSDGSRDGTAAFYGWLRQHLNREVVLLNIGAGPETKDPKRILRGEVRTVIGIDIDPIVLTNRELDQAFIINSSRFPLKNAQFDFAYADYVLEHVEHPATLLAEVLRVLKPGGSFFFRTPNHLHYVSMISRATPHWFHRLVANRIRGLPQDVHDPWPTFYRANSARRIKGLAKQAGFSNVEMRMFEAEPSYLVFSRLAFALGIAYERSVNAVPGLHILRANIFGKLTK